MFRPRTAISVAGKRCLGSMQRRDILTGLVAAIGSWAVGTDRARGVPHSQVHMLPGQGHEAMYAAPGMLAAAIADFLSA